ncbi:putative xyloglucan-specific endo-beta-1,4-glucanase [Medicago truncatula]|uniref:Putative xyloglucan-specific endo-beta-1,4-glucanase n=1 Tax=Medicago truncatula TaxID=3880 RepID=G7JF95_MEDTR|nr:xyloglucan endotransglucosylase/hydrolase, putative [Medicago truncatula]RHN63081.1 putative xyloglucan-specific endo-beta-1,4-glucanase [Medicago truncatula]
MTIFYPFKNNGIFFMLLLWIVVSSVWGRPATFNQDFHVTWSEPHIKQIDQGRTIQLTLDQGSCKQHIYMS